VSRAPGRQGPRPLKLVRWLVYGALGLHVLLALLLVGKHPLLIRAVSGMLSSAAPGQEAMRLLLYRNPDRSGHARIRYAPTSVAQLDAPNASLEAHGVWRIREAGTYALVFRCDARGAVFVDGHRVIGLIGTSANNVGRAAVPLGVGSHLLVVHLASGPGSGWFSLEVQAPGAPSPTPLAPPDLHAVAQRLVTQAWPIVLWSAAWVRHWFFWASLGALLIVALACQGAQTLRQAGAKGLLVVAGSLVAIGLGEIAVRLVLPSPARVSFRNAGDRRAGEPNVFMIPTERGFRHSPNSEVAVQHPVSPQPVTIYQTNSIGYRNPEIGPKQGTRILFLGDSITLGLALNEPDTFVRRVERLARDQGKDWETINAAVNGLGTNGELAVLNETGLSVDPDIVVLGFYLNDFLESPGIYVTSLPGILNQSSLAHQVANVASSLLLLSSSEREGQDSPPMLKPPDEIFAWRDEFRQKSTVTGGNPAADAAAIALNQAILKSFEDWGGAFSPHVWSKLEGLLREFARLAREHKFRLVITAFPVRHQVEAGPLFDYPQQRLHRISEQLGVPFLDLLPALRSTHAARQAPPKPLFLDHCHLTPYGSEVVAQEIYRFLERLTERSGQRGSGPARPGSGARGHRPGAESCARTQPAGREALEPLARLEEHVVRPGEAEADLRAAELRMGVKSTAA
jgi:lysophospholipase L1-like esterase